MFFLLVIFLPLFSQTNLYFIEKGTSKVIQSSNVRRVSIGDAKLVSVKVVDNNQLLMTGRKVGHTVLYVWNDQKDPQAIEIQVTEPSRIQMLPIEVVHVSLEFLELNQSFHKTLGVKWPDSVQWGAHGSHSSTTGLNYNILFSSAEGMIRYLIKEGWAKILASPDLYVRLGEQAVFHSGGEFPVASSIGKRGNYHRKIEWKPYGLTVNVKPQSKDGLHIQTDIHVEYSEINKADAIEDIPGIIKRNVNTKMNSKDGETVILSGLVRSSRGASREGLPALSNIPLLGGLFSQKTESQEETEILMSLTLSFSSQTRAKERIQKIKGDS